MSDRSKLMAELAAALEELRALKPASKADLRRWYELAQELKTKIMLPEGLASAVPSFVWHYLSDADIRCKDEEYADLQDRQLRLLVQCLKRGEMPSDEEIKEYA